ncbi:hypothetical protein LCGC14_2180310, partial [marine sediment metagenome]
LAAAELLNTMIAPRVLAGHKVRISANIGISIYPKDDEVTDFLVRKASIAMHQAKGKAGEEAIAFFHDQNKQTGEAA